MTHEDRVSRFRELYDQHFGLVWTVVGQLGLCGAAREDAAQEVWLAAYRRLHTLESERAVRAWLCTIARRIVWRSRRTQDRAQRRVAAFATEPAPLVVDPHRRLEARTTVEAALDSLSEAQRRVVVLARVHGLTAPEISDGLGIPLNTVYSRLRHARRRLDAFEADREALLAAMGAEARPPESVQKRAWLLLAPKLLPTAAATVPIAAASMATTLKGAAVGVALGSAVLVGGATLLAPAPGHTQAQRIANEGAMLAPAEHVAVATAPSTSAPAPAPVFTEEPAPPTESAPAAAPRRPRARRGPTPEPAPEATPAAPVAPEPRPETVDAETELLRQAHAALGRGEPLDALELLNQHRARFPEGGLSDLRDGTRVRVLCELGFDDQARREADRLLKLHPESAVARAVLEGCKAEG